MGLGILVLLDSCPTLHFCCFCVSIRAGVLYGACMGIVWGTIHILAYLPVGVTTLKELGLPEIMCQSKGVRYFHYALGVILCALHTLLLGSSLAKNSSLCSLYAGTAIALSTALTLLGLTVSLTSLSLGLIALGEAFLILVLALVAAVVLLYLSAVVANYCSTIPSR